MPVAAIRPLWEDSLTSGGASGALDRRAHGSGAEIGGTRGADRGEIAVERPGVVINMPMLTWPAADDRDGGHVTKRDPSGLYTQDGV